MFGRRWIFTTLLALAAVGVMARLGIWQLDRLSQRRDFNARVEAQIDQDVMILDGEIAQMDLYDMEYRLVEVRGEYDHGVEVVLLNRDWRGNLGVDIITPLRIANSDMYVLVDRGWVPQEHYRDSKLEQYHLSGEVLVRGYLRRAESEPTFGGVPDATLAPGQPRLEQWNVVNVERIARENGLDTLPLYIQELGIETDAEPPIPSELSLDLTEGPHMGYALQWFTFAAILLIGYPYYVQKTEKVSSRQEN